MNMHTTCHLVEDYSIQAHLTTKSRALVECISVEEYLSLACSRFSIDLLVISHEHIYGWQFYGVRIGA